MPLFKLIYPLIILLLAAATIIEWRLGTHFVAQHIYGSFWFALLLAAAAIPALLFALRRLRANVPAFILHLALILIALGALLTRFTAQDGILHLRQGHLAHTFLSSSEPHDPIDLPVTLTLDSFRIVYYPHTDAPRDYVSYLTVDASPCQLSMNNVLTTHGYRFYQTSYDPDGLGSVITVARDPWGMTVTYTGYVLAILGLILTLANPRGRFRRLLRSTEYSQLRKNPLFLPLLLPLLLPLTSCSNPDTLSAPVPSDAEVDNFSRLDIIYNNRPAPIDTYSADFLLKVTGRTSFAGLSPNAVVLAWLLHPDAWQDVPMIRVKDTDTALAMNLHPVNGYLSPRSLFSPNGDYLLTPFIRNGHKAAIDINDRLQAIVSLTDGSAFRIAPRPIPPLRRSVEVAYARLRPVALLFMSQLTLGLLMLLLAIFAELRPSRAALVRSLLRLAAILSVTLQSLALALRGYIARAWPLANGFETMLLLALVLAALALLLSRRFSLLAAASLLMSGFALLVAHIAISNPHITPLMPVLHSPWLSIHVASVMIAYALFTVIMLNSVIAFASGNAANPASLRVSILLLYVAVTLLALGICVGAVWAGQSWGRYWGWDPKEVWALITLLIYILPLHPSLYQKLPLKKNPNPKNTHLYLILAFLTVLMTYFGVNYLLGGLHSYA